jgi:hypothetical protein
VNEQDRSPQPGGIGRHLPALAIFAVVTVLLTWPLVSRMDDTFISWGDPVFQAWTIAWDWHALKTDPLGIFDANVFYPWGNTLAYSDHLFGQALTVLPVIALTENGILADNVATLLAFFLSALAMYLLVYDMTGNRIAGILAGVAYAFAPSRVAHLEHLHLLSAQWPPLLLLCLRRVCAPGLGLRDSGMLNRPARPERLNTGTAELVDPRFPNPESRTPHTDSRALWFLGLGACFFAQGLFGIYFLYFSIVMLIIAGAVYAAFALLDRDWDVMRALGLAALTCAFAGALLIPTLLPYWRVSEDLDVERTTAEVSAWSAEPTDYLAVWPRARAWNELLDRFHRDVERDLFPGLAIVVLAGVGLTHRTAGRQRWVLLAVAVGGVVFSFGLSATIAGREIPLPYRAFYDWLPGFRAIRVPARLGLLALVGVGGLAGLGVDRLWRLGRDELPLFSWYPHPLARRPRLVGTTIAALALTFILLETVPRMELPDPLPAPPDNPPPAYAWIRDNPAPTLELPMGEGLVGSAWPNFWSMFHWNQTVNGYSGIVPPTYYPFREAMREFPSDESIQLLQGIGVVNIIVHEDFPDRERADVEAQLAAHPELTLELAGPDAVYRLAEDPWMWDLARAVPNGEVVDLPNAAADPVTFGMLMALLQRTGHDVTGHGQVDYFHFSPPENDVCYAVLLDGDNPANYGYPSVIELASEGNLVLYTRPECIDE